MKNKGKFKKGHTPWNKNKSVRLNPDMEFQSGNKHPYYKKRGTEVPHFKGQPSITKHGYVLIYSPDHIEAYASGYVLEHRYKMSNKLGRKLLRNEIVHHIDGNKQNNKLSNLMLLSKSQHTLLHLLTHEFIVKEGLIKKYLKWFKKNV